MTSRAPLLDVLIAGGGLAGLSVAVALKRALGSGVSLLVCDSAFGRRRPGTRASAIAAGPRRMFEALGVWQKIAERTQPILDMSITDSRASDPVRPVFLTFGGDLEPGEPFAHMVFNDDLILALEDAAKGLGVEIAASGVASFGRQRGCVEVLLGNGVERRARLLVAADGERSALREAAGVRMVGWGYGQSGIVATIAHEKDHGGLAEEHFLPAGPFAILPLPGRRSSIVWTERAEQAKHLVGLPSGAFMAELEPRFGYKRGALELLDQPRAYALGLRVARRFVSERLALVGDAAHVIHPIAGQGLNMGLRDAAVLVEFVIDRMRLGLDPGEEEPLAAYERARRFDTLAMAASTDALNRLFSNDLLPVRLIRDLGLGLVDRLPSLKQAFVREAAGIAGAAPSLMRRTGRLPTVEPRRARAE